MLTVGVIILEHPTSGVVLKLFRPAKVKSVKTGPSFVGVQRLVTGLSEGKERLQLRNVRDYLDSFRQSTTNSHYTS